MNYINENTVLDFYLEQMDKNNIEFLKNREELKAEVKENVIELRGAEELHEKIEIAKRLWKVLFEASMSHIDPDMRGYDDLFKYFDEYVNFEELIFASDSFYRDHTMHCLWVYFLGEYLFKNESFKEVFKNENPIIENIKSFCKVIQNEGLEDKFSRLGGVVEAFDIEGYEDSMRCIAALTHDLGYPIKKINKVNKCIGKILPYFSLNNYSEFNFSYNSIQQGFIENFIEFMSKGIGFSNNEDIECDENTAEKLSKFLQWDENGLIGIKAEEFKHLESEEVEIIKKVFEMKAHINEKIGDKLRYYNDFEQYEHGIMSAFLLIKIVKAFSPMNFNYVDHKTHSMLPRHIKEFNVKRSILTAISDHTSNGYKIEAIDGLSEFLLLVDELEEFSRISRANMNRQYVEEFCKSNIYYEEGWLNVDFIFDNENIENLDPERAFKGRCKRFLTLFNIRELSEALKIRIRCIGKLSYNDNVYTLEIARKYANIIINDMEQNIPRYLSSRQFYTKEGYMNL